MNRTELTELISSQYGAEPEFLWSDAPDYAVFRHGNNQKWFAVIMDVPRNRVGLKGTEKIDIVNFKADPFLIGSLLGQTGFFPAYHMNKALWISAALDGSASDEDILMLLDMSFDLTGVKNNGTKQYRHLAG